MSVLRSTVSLLGVYNVNAEDNSEEATYEQSIQLMAKSTIIQLLHVCVKEKLLWHHVKICVLQPISFIC